MTPNYATALQVLAPTAEWTITDITKYSSLVWHSTDITKPTQEALDSEVSRQISAEPLEKCKAEAKKRIASSDWSVLPDVGISNVSDFEAYRAALRELIKNPVVDPVFPNEPQPVWTV